MTNPKLLITCLIILFAYVAKAEIIDGPANFRAKPNGKILFSLNDGLRVECMPIKNNWFEVSFTINITKDQYDKHLEVKKGDKLYDRKGNIITIAKADIPSYLTISSTYGGAPGNPKVYEMEIRGYVSRSNIKETSIPENALNHAINQNRLNLSYGVLKDFILLHGYEKDGIIKKVYPKLNDYVIEESSVNGGSVTDRIDLIFEDDQLILIAHSRPLRLNGVRDYDLAFGLRLAVIRPPRKQTVETFIKKYREAYNGAG
jgi:hypothetical protein